MKSVKDASIFSHFTHKRDSRILYCFTKKLISYDKYLKFTEPELIHITVRFIGGSVSRKSYGKLSSIIEGEILKHEAFNIRIKEARFGFPNQRWPRILYVSVMKNENLDKIVSCVNNAISSLNLPDIEEYKYRDNMFHFTLARTKSRLNIEVIANIRKALKKMNLWEGFRINSIKLIESELKKECPVYKVLNEIKLKG